MANRKPYSGAKSKHYFGFSESLHFSGRSVYGAASFKQKRALTARFYKSECVSMYPSNNSPKYKPTFGDRMYDLKETLKDNWIKATCTVTLVAAAVVGGPDWLHHREARLGAQDDLALATDPTLIVETDKVTRMGTIFLGHAQKIDQDNPQDNLALLTHEPAACRTVTLTVVDGKQDLPFLSRLTGNSQVVVSSFDDPSYRKGYVCLGQEAAISPAVSMDEDEGETVEPTEDATKAGIERGPYIMRHRAAPARDLV